MIQAEMRKDKEPVIRSYVISKRKATSMRERSRTKTNETGSSIVGNNVCKIFIKQ